MKQPKETLSPKDRELLTFGLAAQIPGYQKAINYLQEGLDAMKAQLSALQGHTEEPARRGRPLKKNANKSGWGHMTKEERRTEMARRRRLWKNTPQEKPKFNKNSKPTKLHPRDPQHPDHAKWLKKIAAVQKKRWAGMSFKQRKERLTKMREGKKKRPVVVKLEAAS